ncbi:hypothetical protein NEOLEDRAFT_1131270 [Neolentinus lepideus HHB14362 ss-1]|uniref:Uncharacterized protein n=1 Tax=Neolentinus lepideus HHB14362 ss-1 TaxID=1314782 RepID=A0A165TV89_9AGAM|nr:hypothetical protein NEOLEDRAFT_1131270 [Neolentinus lepideus HHB14362 ss-1]
MKSTFIAIGFILVLTGHSRVVALQERQVVCEIACVPPRHFCAPCGCYLTPCPPSTTTYTFRQLPDILKQCPVRLLRFDRIGVHFVICGGTRISSILKHRSQQLLFVILVFRRTSRWTPLIRLTECSDGGNS